VLRQRDGSTKLKTTIPCRGAARLYRESQIPRPTTTERSHEVAKRRVSESRAFARSPQVASASRRESMEVTGSFGAFRKPALVGVSDTVRIANRDLARRARREMTAWSRTLPKGVTI